MATVKQKAGESANLDKEKLISLYMEYVLEHDAAPNTIYKFCKDNKISEEEFYNFFGSFEGLKKGIWSRFFDHSLEVIQKSPDYNSFHTREKLLTFYFTFFEVLTANRSYVLFTLQEENQPLRNLEQLKVLRKKMKSYASQLIREDNEEKSAKFLKNSEMIFSEAAWVQLLFLIKFWRDDNSPRFERTDVAIEKSVNTAFDLLDNSPLERVLDLGKFLWKEKMA
ncbi:TetR family transcriptional regulator C-terminal domain-containing protein [Salinimicrobium sp. GXAS 041]|uniref:TetR family transcriptional regulator C-terminal domain-containing protein n=1 Tax=Salinimicrobium sp. GXAS 041 TaxID=3400806 RepID=UPI003C77651E